MNFLASIDQYAKVVRLPVKVLERGDVEIHAMLSVQGVPTSDASFDDNQKVYIDDLPTR